MPRRPLESLSRSRIAAAFACSLILAFGSDPAAAQTTANGPYYATPSWDQTLPAVSRFIVLANFNGEAVLDRETGLVWQRSPTPRGFSSLNFRTGCQIATTGGKGGWRLPTASELYSLFDVTPTTTTGLPPGSPFTGLPVEDASYPSSTRETGELFFVLDVRNGTGVAVVTYNARRVNSTDPYTPLCVRSPGAPTERL